MQVRTPEHIAGNLNDRQHSTRGSREWFSYLLRSQGQSDPSAYFALSGYHRHRHQQIVQFLQSAGAPPVRHALLDIGCGTGHLTDLLRRKLGFQRAVGIDFVPELISRVRRRYPDTDFQVGSLPRVDFPDGSFDLVIAAEVLYYLDEQQQAAALSEIRRILKPDGALLFTSVIGDSYFTTQSATNALARELGVVATAHDHNRFYHATLGRLTLLKRLDHVISTKTAPGTATSHERLMRWSWLTNSTVFRGALKAVCLLSAPLLRWRWIPDLLSCVSRCLAPRATATNVNIIARKESSYHDDSRSHNRC